METVLTANTEANKKQYRLLIVLTVILMALSCLSIGIFGTHCTLEFAVTDPDSLTVEYDRSIVECVSQQLSGGTLTLEFRAVSSGNTFLIVGDDLSGDLSQQRQIFVHPTGVITLDSYFGKCRGDIMFSGSIIVIELTMLLMLIRRYRRSAKENLCRYVNARLLGAVIFLAFVFAEQLMSLIILNQQKDNPSLMQITEETLHSAQFFSSLLLPLAVIISLAISISNLILLKREGFRLKNMLGFFLGIVLCVGSVAPALLYEILRISGVDVYRYSSPAVLFDRCMETLFAIIMAYFEAMLMGTALSALRAARHIPAFDKDCILILGCQIKKDGGLTKLLQSRADRALKFAEMQKAKTGKELLFVPSGGKGGDEVIAEAEAIRNYLVSEGIPEERILVENRSETTNQNLRFSHDLIMQKIPDAKIAFSTTNYHVFRAGCYAEEAGIPMEGIGAKTRPYFWINAFIREFVAGLHHEKRKHIRNLLLILLVMLPIEAVLYYVMM